MRFFIGLLTVCLIQVSALADEGEALTHEQALSMVPGSTMSRIGQNGGLREWTNGADGTATVSRLPGPGSKQGVRKAAARWSVSDDGRYCLDEDWSTGQGGPLHWCSRITRDADGKLQLLH
ncbi:MULTISPECIES: hypothetical protein [Paraburkholderia]|uniref:Uncharacterized protein n=2 Tax=Paraburkholderia TaxID=1822464 RepID=A0A7Y9W5P5_9BURK|nr:hypothetical protein [Paraburkholderia bryophila]NYH14771.1 hypothetical protein [Paraburkholderia bryophila]NYH26912.1 hypothetical protein [Paraburkholderia bryophila]